MNRGCPHVRRLVWNPAVEAPSQNARNRRAIEDSDALHRSQRDLPSVATEAILAANAPRGSEVVIHLAAVSYLWRSRSQPFEI